MLYHSTRSDKSCVDSAQAVLEGLAPDGGLYMPQAIPAFDWKKCLTGSSMDMATDILSALLPDIPEGLYQQIRDRRPDPHRTRGQFPCAGAVPGPHLCI